MSSSPIEIVCAHSPDSDDAYMFYALATRKIRSRLVSFRHVLEEIESLNRKAREGCYALTAISYHAYPYVADRYVLMASGSSVGDGYGPVLLANHPMALAEIKGKRIAVPGALTTACLALRIVEPDFEPVVVPFDKILDALAEHSVELGLVIHEGQMTFSRSGFHKVLDLGAWWKSEFDLPLPLGPTSCCARCPARSATNAAGWCARASSTLWTTTRKRSITRSSSRATWMPVWPRSSSACT